MSRQNLLRLPEIGETIKLFTFQNVKEEALDLYGFLTYEELEFFETLMEIRGVGPKISFGYFSSWFFRKNKRQDFEARRKSF